MLSSQASMASFGACKASWSDLRSPYSQAWVHYPSEVQETRRRLLAWL